MTNDDDPVEQNAREQIRERADTQKFARGCFIVRMIFIIPLMIALIWILVEVL